MKYTCEIVVDRPREAMVALFDNPDNMKHWQPELQSFTALAGTPGQPGATSKLVYKMGSRVIEMVETVTERNLPDTFAGTYSAKGVFNTVRNTFQDEGASTRWIMETDFQFSGFMKIIALFMPGMFRKQSLKMMQQFKVFAEKSA